MVNKQDLQACCQEYGFRLEDQSLTMYHPL